jgi:thiamine-phosphate pyrophosphorylase
MKDPGVYAIMTEPKIGYRAFMEICVQEKLPVVQLRDKNLPDGDLLDLARELSAIRAGSGTKLIINDRADIAYLAGADGVHLGQDDLRMSDASRLWPARHISGLSTHSISQVSAALAQKPDYIGFGPVFPTPTKAKADPAVGIAALREVIEAAPCPVICIGGIDSGNVESVLEAGARNVCMVRYFCDCASPRSRITEIQKLVTERGISRWSEG